MGVHLSKAAGFWTVVLLGMSSYAGILGFLLKCSELPIFQNASGWLLPFVFTFRKCVPSYLIALGTFLLDEILKQLSYCETS